jgi:hypothetical protein
MNYELCFPDYGRLKKGVGTAARPRLAVPNPQETTSYGFERKWLERP